MTDILQELEKILAERRSAEPGSSYVASLHEAGLNKILEKVGEESTEVILAAKDAGDDTGRRDLIAETADLWFHCMVMLSHLEISHGDVLEELQRRFGQSGHDEKASRSQ